MKISSHNSEDMALAVGAKALHDGRAFMYEAVKEYREKYIDQKTGSFFSNYLEERVCPTCSGSQFRSMFKKGGGHYVKCTACSMVILNPAFKDTSLESYYRGYATTQSSVVKNESEFYKKIYGKGLSTIQRFSSPGRVLDIGCSTGFFLDVAKHNSWETFGVELNEKEIKEAATSGHHVLNADVANAEFGVKFDAVTMWDVIEHIKDGSAILNKIKGHLNDKGVLFIQTPSSDALAARVMHEKCNMFDGLEHVNIYSPSTIQRLAEGNGFRILSLETVISEIPVVSNYLSYEDPYLGETVHGGEILGLIDEPTLHKNLLGYKMQVVMAPV